MSHTPGPWWAADNVHQVWRDALMIGYGPDRRGAGADSGIIAYTTRGFENGPSWSNARLIAAAPDLLAALQEIVADPTGIQGNLELARVAIAKATAA